MQNLFLVLMMLVISACGALKPKEDMSQKDLVQQLNYLYRDNVSGIKDKNPEMIGITKNNVMNEFNKSWCSYPSNDFGRSAHQIASKHCLKLGGNYGDQWCRSKDDKPLFFIAINDKKYNNDYMVTRNCREREIVTLFASTSEGLTQSIWEANARIKYGFLTYKQINQQRIEANKREIEEKENQIMMNVMGIQNRGVGRRVCKDIDRNRYTGFVEQINNHQIYVLVEEKSMNYSNNPNNGIALRDMNFRPTRIWDDISKWYPCDSQSERDLMR